MQKDNGTRKTRMNEAIINFLIDIPMFDKVLADELSIVAKHMNFIELSKLELLFKEGDKGDYLCFVVNGILDVVKKTERGRSVVIAQLGKGRSIGEMSIIDNTPRSATVRAKTKCILITLTKKGFDSILDNHPVIGIKMLKGIARLLSLNMRKTSGKLADYMLT